MLIKVIPVFENMFKDFGGGAAAEADAGRHQHLARVRRPLVPASSASLVGIVFGVLGGATNRAGASAVRQVHLAGADHRRRHAQDRRRALHAHARHAAVVGRADPRRARHRAPRPRATSSSRTRIMYARAEDLRRQEHGRAARRDEGVPADGRADDRRRRADRRDGPDAAEDRRLLRRGSRRRRRPR